MIDWTWNSEGHAVRVSMEVCTEKDIHEGVTERGQLRYCFTPKHHGAGLPSDSRWLPDLTRLEEFQVFDMADFHELRDEDRDLYGLRISGAPGNRELLDLGCKHEKVARFWAEGRPTDPWHGHPLWPLRSKHAENRAKQGCCPPREVFDRMIEVGILSAKQASRLKIAKHVGKLD
jgi:hypothetical protein